jgi:hypothetical protein
LEYDFVHHSTLEQRKLTVNSRLYLKCALITDQGAIQLGSPVEALYTQYARNALMPIIAHVAIKPIM